MAHPPESDLAFLAQGARARTFVAVAVRLGQMRPARTLAIAKVVGALGLGLSLETLKGQIGMHQHAINAPTSVGIEHKALQAWGEQYCGLHSEVQQSIPQLCWSLFRG